MRAVRLATGWTLLLSLLISFPETTLAQAAAVCGVAKLSFDVPLVVLGGVKTPVRFSLLAGGFPANTSLILEILATYTTPDGNSAPAATGSLEVVVDSGGILDMSDQLHMTSKKSLSEFDLALLVRAGVNGTVVATAPARPVRVIPAFLSILPALLIVTMAVWSRNVVLALLAGLTLGGIFISPGSTPHPFHTPDQPPTPSIPRAPRRPAHRTLTHNRNAPGAERKLPRQIGGGGVDFFRTLQGRTVDF